MEIVNNDIENIIYNSTTIDGINEMNRQLTTNNKRFLRIDTNTLIPLCLSYKEGLSRISLPFIDKNGDYICSRENDWKLYKKIWVYNYNNYPPLIPKAKTYIITNTKAFPYNSIDITEKFDPFWSKLSLDAIRFIAYSEYVPNTIPLYIYKKDSSIYFTLDRQDNLTPHHLSPIYVMDKNYTYFNKTGGVIYPSESGAVYSELLQTTKPIQKDNIVKSEIVDDQHESVYSVYIVLVVLLVALLLIILGYIGLRNIR